MTTLTKLHVLHIASGDLWAGAEVQLYTLARALQKRGDLRVTVLLMNEGELAERLRHAGIETFVLPEGSLSFPQLLLKTMTLTRRLRPDVIHTHRIKENLLGGLAGLLLRIPSLRTQHGAEEHPASWQAPHKVILQKLDHWLAAQVQKFTVAVTPELGGTLSKHIPEHKIRVVENGIDAENFSLPALDTLDSRFQQAHRRVGIIGRLSPVKRVDLFVDMAALLATSEKFADVQFFVFGDGPLKLQLQTQTAASHLENRLHFMGHQSNIHGYLQHLDALVMCSDHEGLPMTLLEAMSLNVAVIGHNVGGIKLLLDNGNNGFPVENHTAQGYAEAVKICLADTDKRKQKCDQAQTRVATSYSATKNAESFLLLYQDMAHSRPTA